ncbi:MAG: hypothetical protein HY290_18395 [Planctomycetia bacterium]|nr:hypothetical protein [Planctomycetia bacterium]
MPNAVQECEILDGHLSFISELDDMPAILTRRTLAGENFRRAIVTAPSPPTPLPRGERGEDGKMHIHLFGSTPEEREEKERKDKDNALWHAGYGYGNPNPDRIKKGLPPVDF